MSSIITSVTNSLRRMALNFLGASYVDAVFKKTQVPSLRQAGYQLREMLYDGNVYRPGAYGGLMETIFRVELGREPTKNMRVLPWFNPVPQIVEAYQGIYGGTFGAELRVHDHTRNRPTNPKLIATETSDPIGDLWSWSNLESAKSKLIRWGSNLGTVGIRVVARDAGDPSSKRVWLQFDHPQKIQDFETDDRDNVTAVRLEYDVQKPAFLGDPNPSTVEVVEILTRDEFSVTVDGKQTLPDEQRKNLLGFCPYVVLRHLDDGDRFGAWAYKGIESKIHGVNWQISRQDKSVDRHIFPRWFAAAGGPSPKNLEMGEDTVTYVPLTGDSPTPVMTPLVAQINHADTTNFWKELIELAREQCPEMLLNNMRLLSNVSGETVAQMMKPVEARIMAARANYDHAVIRAMQMGLSYGILMGIWDLGGGVGSKEIADKSFQSGLLNFEFAPRSVMQPTPYEKITNSKAKVADRTQGIVDATAAQQDVSHANRLRWMGFTEKEIKDNDKEQAEQDIIPAGNPDDLNPAGK